MSENRLPADKEYPHGTRARYTFNRCRCLACTDANRDRVRARSAPRKLIWRAPGCGATRVVRNYLTGEVVFRGPPEEAARRRDALNARDMPDPQRMTGHLARDVRAHIERLKEAGVGERQISRLAGVDRKTIYAFMRGRPIWWVTANKILGVRPVPAPGAYVDGTETWRLIGEMLAAGATRKRIARELGSTAKVPALQLRSDRVKQSSADKVKRLHDRFYLGSGRMREVCRCGVGKK